VALLYRRTTFAALLVACPTLHAATYWVSPSGNDGNSGTSPTSPFGAIPYAVGLSALALL
jgi:hypothetical protein